MLTRLLTCIKLGLSVVDSCAAARMSQSAYYRAMEKAEDPEMPEVYRQFRDSISHARADGLQELVTVAGRCAVGGVYKLSDGSEVDCGEPDGRLALELLSRRRPEQWARLAKHEVTGADGGPLPIQFYLPAEETDDDAESDTAGERGPAPEGPKSGPRASTQAKGDG